MTKIHKLKFDGYSVGDRLLEDTYFGVNIEIDGKKANITSVEPWDEFDAVFLEQINIPYFEKKIRKYLEEIFTSLATYYEENDSDYEQDIAEYEEEVKSNDPLVSGIQFLLEI